MTVHQKKLPAGLHVLTDTVLQQRFSHVDLARLAREGGADFVQLREKRGFGESELIDVGRGVKDMLSGGPGLIINDRVDLAATLVADGVHLGVDDIDPRVARATLGDRMLIGATANSMGQAQVASRRPVDYLGVGPVFGTTSKRNPAPTLGLERLRDIVAAVGVPVIAIGGIGIEQVADVMRTGVAGIAILSAFCCADDPVAACQHFREAMRPFQEGE